MTGFLHDVRFALRVLVKNPGLAIVTIVTLGLAIGANTTVFSIVDSVLLDPMPYPQPDRLVRLFTQLPRQGHDRYRLSTPEYEELLAHTTSFESIGAWNEAGAPVSGGTEPARVPAAYVTTSLLRTIGVAPARGRWFDDTDAQPGTERNASGAGSVIISDRLWRRAFAADSAIVGREIMVDGLPVSVIGVMPLGYAIPRPDIDVWVPVDWLHPTTPEPRDATHGLDVIARLKPGVSLAQARDDLGSFMAWSKQTYPPGMHPLSAPDHPIVVRSLAEDTVGTAALSLLLLQGAVAFLLLIAGANIASVLLARADARSREMAIRAAVGAHRGRIIRQLLTESLVLGLFGAALGIALASWGVELAVRLLPETAPRKHEIGISGTTLILSVALSLLSSILFGLAPAFRAGRLGQQGGLKEASARTTTGRGRLRLRRVLVVAQVSFAIVLVVGCGLMLRSLARLQRVVTGFEADGLITMRIELPQPQYPTVGSVYQLWSGLQERTRALPGVRAATIMGERPLSRTENQLTIWRADAARPEGETAERPAIQMVGDQYALTMGIPVIRGRDFDERDHNDEPARVVINEELARRLWPDEDPIGHQLIVGLREVIDKRPTIIGVVGNIKQDSLAAPAPPLVYFPSVKDGADLGGNRVMLLAVRVTGDPRRIVPDIRRVLHGLDPRLAISEVNTMNELLWQEVARPRFLSVLLTAIASIALLLAAIGVFGVMSHSVGQRTREIGIRKALGASSAAMRRMILRDGLTIVAIGVVLGLVAATAINTLLANVLSGMLFDVNPLDPWTFVVAPLVLVAVGGIACWIPAAKATRVDPMQAMRHE